jgi:hypothetical protein
MIHLRFVLRLAANAGTVVHQDPGACTAIVRQVVKIRK